MPIEPYLFFEGRAEEALEFYRKALDAKVGMLMRYKDSPEAPPAGMVPPGSENKVMHADFRIKDAQIMISDGSVSGKPSFSGFSLSISVDNEKEARRYFDALAEGGNVTMPLSKTFWSPLFGMVTDKFGVGWMIGIPGTPP